MGVLGYGRAWRIQYVPCLIHGPYSADAVLLLAWGKELDNFLLHLFNKCLYVRGIEEGRVSLLEGLVV